MKKKNTFSLILLSEIGIFMVINACAVNQAYEKKPSSSSVLAEYKQENTSVQKPYANDLNLLERNETKINTITEGLSSLTLKSAIEMALDNNPNFQIDRKEPEISKEKVKMQESIFDPILSSSLKGEGSKEETNKEGEIIKETTEGEDFTANVRLKKYFSAGSTLDFGLNGGTKFTDNYAENPSKYMGMDATLTQPLLRGQGSEVNLASLRSAQLDMEISIYELRASAEALITQTEQAYWNYFLAEKSIKVYEKSLEIANHEVEEVKERILIGKIAETELIAAEAEAASRQEQLIDANNILSKRRFDLIRLLTAMDEGESLWNQKLHLEDIPYPQSPELKNVEEFVTKALQDRPDINQARLQLKQSDLEIVRTRNGLLPKLDLFITLGGSRYANSFSDIDDKEGYELSYAAGISFEMPLSNKGPNAQHRIKVLSKEQAQIAFRNMESLIQVDIRSAYVDVESSFEKVKATGVTRNLREKNLNVEVEKFRIGRSTIFQVSQARRDMVASEIAEIEAIVQYRKSLSDLYRLEGAVLERWGMTVE